MSLSTTNQSPAQTPHIISTDRDNPREGGHRHRRRRDEKETQKDGKKETPQDEKIG